MSLIPSTIGRFRVLDILGSGAMGTVYLAEDPLLKRTLAIKVVRAGTANSEVLLRFKQEAEVSAQLNHPNSVTIFDVGEEADLGPYLVMEYVEGGALSDLIRRGPMEPDEVARLLVQAADALTAMHALGILHRDIKPDNFMMTKDGRLKLMDFGIARGDQLRLTAASIFLGTPGYAAPEVLRGAEASPASDCWAFTITAFEMLTGTLPFVAGSVGTTLYRIVHEAPVWPPNLSPELAIVFEKALDKDPKNRYPDLTSFLRALIEALPLKVDRPDAYLAQLIATAQMRDDATLRIERPAVPSSFRWNRWLWGGGALVLVLGILFLRLRPAPSRVLSIDSKPAGAEVFLDGTPLGSTPLRQVVIKGHADLLRLEKADYVSTEYTLKAEDKDLILRLLPAPFPLQVISDPPGAEVFLDDETKGNTPAAIDVPGEGSHRVRVVLEGYQPWSAIPERRKVFPDPIRLQKAGGKKGAGNGKIKKFFKGVFQK